MSTELQPDDDFLEMFKRPPQETLVLSPEAFDAFIKRLENPQPPNERLRAAMQRYRENQIAVAAKRPKNDE